MLGVEIERAAADNRESSRQRLAVALLTAIVLVPWFGPAFIAAWLAVLATTEMVDRRVAIAIAAGSPHHRRHRLLLLAAIAVSTASWSLIAVRLWGQDGDSLRLVAILILAIQMMHAQTYGYRSRAFLAAQMGIPAATIPSLVMTADIPGTQMMLIGPAVLIGIAYVFVGAEANGRAARALDASRAEIERLAYRDVTTDLANRRSFAERLDVMVRRAHATGTGFTLVLLDLDGLKQINDQHGHDVGDRALVAFADRLRQVSRPDDVIARLGGDEFGWLVAAGNDPPCGDQPLCAMLPIAGIDHQLCASVGIARFPADGDSADRLFKAADVALYAAKPNPRPTASKYDQRWSRRPLLAGGAAG